MGVAVNSDQGQGKLAKGDSSRIEPASANHLLGMSGRELCSRNGFNEMTSESSSKYKFL